MKHLIFLLLLAAGMAAQATKYYVAPTGSDGNPGTISLPKATLNGAWSLITSGTADTIYLRGGTYSWSTKQSLTNKNGTVSRRILIAAYPGEHPIIRKPAGFPDNTNPFEFWGNYVHFRGIEIVGYKQASSTLITGMYVWGANHCIFENITIHHCSNGLYIRGDGAAGNPVGATHNYIINCDLYDNKDSLSSYDDADGLGIQFVPTSTDTNWVIGCRLWNNSDDGLDFDRNDGVVYVLNCWAWHNGYREDETTAGGNGNGFKLGLPSGVDQSAYIKRYVYNCVASENTYWGFHENSAAMRMVLYNNIAYNNLTGGIHLYGPAGDIACTVKNNIAYNNHSGNASYQYYLSPSSTVSSNSWQVSTVTDADFFSKGLSELEASRKSDGSLPGVAYLHPVKGSDLIDKGTDIGLLFSGTAPDLGPFEYVPTLIVEPSGKFIKTSGKFIKPSGEYIK